jgi:hypothetical protein
MAKNAIQILSDPARLQEFKSNALKTAEKFDIQHILPLYESVYQRAIDLKKK